MNQRNLDKTKSAAVAAAAGTAAATSNTSGAGVEVQAAAAMTAAIQAIYTLFSSSTSDISLASLGSFEAITSWLIAKNSSKSAEENIKIATTAVLNAIATNTSSNTLAAMSGIFGNATSISINGKTLGDYSASVIAAVAALMGTDSTLNEIGKTAITQLTSSAIQQAIAADTFNTTIAALFKAVTDIGPNLDSVTAAATVKTLLEQIATSAASAIASSSLSESAKTNDISELKTAAALCVDDLATTGIIPSVDVASSKTNINTQVDTAVVTATATPTPTPTAASSTPTPTPTPTPAPPSPEINIKQSTTSLASGSGSQSFGSVIANSATADLTFTIENTGTATLNISGTPKVALSGADAAEFSVTSQPAATVAASGTTTFVIRFTPVSVAAKTATVTVANDDSDEGTYTFTITGTGSATVTTNSQYGDPSTFNQTNSSPPNIQDWINMSNAVGGDGALVTTATITDAKVETSRLELTGFSFSSSVPSTGTVNGIKVEILKAGNGIVNSAACRDYVVQLIVGGSVVGSNLADTATDWPASASTTTYGGETNKWGLTPTVADVRAANFGVAISSQIYLPNSTGSCTANIDMVRITVYYTPATYRIFTTLTTYDGNLGGLTGADAKCQTRATLAALTGTWKAILSDATTSANERLAFTSGINFYNMAGQIVATSAADLWDSVLNANIHYDETGIATATDAWTGTNPDGSKIAVGQNCTSWTSANAGVSGMSGVPSDTGQATKWITWSPVSCNSSLSLLCIAQ